MPKLSHSDPYIHSDCRIENVDFGSYVEIGKGSRVINSVIGDYSYCDRYADIANAKIGKFSNIASFSRIGPTDHPMHLASLHHFTYRSSYYFDHREDDSSFFQNRSSRIAYIGHDTWIGHGAVVMPEIYIGNGSIVAAGAIVTRDVDPYEIVAGIPAKTIKRRFSKNISARLNALAWWDWEHDVLDDALDDFRSLDIEAFLEKYEA